MGSQYHDLSCIQILEWEYNFFVLFLEHVSREGVRTVRNLSSLSFIACKK